MAKCKICKKNIPDGTEYCNDCQERDKTKSNESYLDSLLKSVINTAPSADSPNLKNSRRSSEKLNNINKGKEEKQNAPEQKETTPDVSFNLDESYQLEEPSEFDDINDFNDFSNFNIEDDLDDNIVINDDELFGKDFTDIFEDTVTSNGVSSASVYQPDDERKPEEPIPGNEFENDIDNDELLEHYSNHSQDAFGNQETEQSNVDPDKLTNDTSDDSRDEFDVLQEALFEGLGDQNQINNEKEMSSGVITEKPNDMERSEKDENETLDTLHSNVLPNEISEFEQDEDFDPDLNDLLSQFDMSGTTRPENISAGDTLQTEEASFQLHDGLEPANLDEIEEIEQTDSDADDFLSLLNQLSTDDPVSADVHAISDLLSGNTPVKQDKKAMPNDVGEVFSDALKAVSSLNDPNLDEEALLSKIPGKKDKIDKKAKKGKKKGKGKSGNSAETANDGEKIGFFQRLFGNVKDEKTKKKAEDAKAEAAKAEFAKAESAATKEAPKKGNAKSDKNAKGASENEKDEASENSKEKGKKPKKEKKEKKKSKEIIQVIDEIDEDEGRINRAGATIVFLFFGILVMVLIIGTNIFSYDISISNAKTYFDRKKYTEAYNEVYGIDIKDKDIETYDKIMTVMFVNKQLNSYNNFYSIKKYPEALDSLLKGLKRYDKYIELATMLGIKSDLDYVREQILAELHNVFNLSEKEALKMIKIDNQAEYSKEVYDVVIEKMGNPKSE